MTCRVCRDGGVLLRDGCKLAGLQERRHES